LAKEEIMEESIKKMVEEEENYHGAIPEDERALEEEVLKKEESLEKSLEEEIYDEEASETGHEKPAMWPGDPKGYNGPRVPRGEILQEGISEDDVSEE